MKKQCCCSIKCEIWRHPWQLHTAPRLGTTVLEREIVFKCVCVTILMLPRDQDLFLFMPQSIRETTENRCKRNLNSQKDTFFICILKVCVRERERERERQCVCVCVWYMCDCVCRGLSKHFSGVTFINDPVQK